MTAEQIKARLRYLSDYELAVMQTDEISGAKDRELDRILAAKAQLHSMLQELKE